MVHLRMAKERGVKDHDFNRFAFSTHASFASCSMESRRARPRAGSKKEGRNQPPLPRGPNSWRRFAREPAAPQPATPVAKVRRRRSLLSGRATEHLQAIFAYFILQSDLKNRPVRPETQTE